MILDKAIEHCYEKANELSKCDCAKEHLQLAHWLKELKDYYKAIEWVESHADELSCNSDEWHGIHIAIKEIRNRIENPKSIDKK